MIDAKALLSRYTKDGKVYTVDVSTISEKATRLKHLYDMATSLYLRAKIAHKKGDSEFLRMCYLKEELDNCILEDGRNKTLQDMR